MHLSDNYCFGLFVPCFPKINDAFQQFQELKSNICTWMAIIHFLFLFWGELRTEILLFLLRSMKNFRCLVTLVKRKLNLWPDGGALIRQKDASEGSQLSCC